MRYLPINLDIRSRPVVVLGGGEIASRKVLRLLEAGALVTVVAPQLTEELRQLALNGRIRHLGREYAAGDLQGAFLLSLRPARALLTGQWQRRHAAAQSLLTVLTSRK